MCSCFNFTPYLPHILYLGTCLPFTLKQCVLINSAVTNYQHVTKEDAPEVEVWKHNVMSVQYTCGNTW